MHKRTGLIVFVLLGLLVLSGCAEKAKVSGTVTFPDGSTLEKGTVVFESNSVRVSGSIKDGYYSLGEMKPGDGVPFGTYKGFITDAWKVVRPENTPAAPAPPPRQRGQPPPGPRGSIIPPTPLIDPKFDSAETSGMTLEVKSRSSIVYNIDVTAPE